MVINMIDKNIDIDTISAITELSKENIEQYIKIRDNYFYPLF